MYRFLCREQTVALQHSPSHQCPHESSGGRAVLGGSRPAQVGHQHPSEEAGSGSEHGVRANMKGSVFSKAAATK